MDSPVLPAKRTDRRAVRGLVLLSGAFLVAQVALTDYGTGGVGAAVTWWVLGCLLLWLVLRKRSRVARALVVVTSLVGAVVYGLGADDGQAAVLAATFLGQALPLLLPPVRGHVATSPARAGHPATERTPAS